MAAKSEFSKNHKKIRFVDISEISPERYITGHKETIESLKNRVNFPDSCPLKPYFDTQPHLYSLFFYALIDDRYTVLCFRTNFGLALCKNLTLLQLRLYRFKYKGPVIY